MSFLNSIWDIQDLDDFGLWVLRLSLVTFGAITLTLMAIVFRERARWQRIPRGVRIFCGFWTTYWSILAIYVFVTNSTPFGDWFRTIYGTGYLGMLWGLVWCLWYTTKVDPECSEGRCRFHNVLMEAISEELKKGDVSFYETEREGGGR